MDIPIMYGFDCYESIYKVGKDGIIPYPKKNEKYVGGHANVFGGYNDNREWLFIKNSWGDKWGDHGWGYLPYDYILNGLANDFWCVSKFEYIDNLITE
jgi:C1A family cysteine protease